MVINKSSEKCWIVLTYQFENYEQNVFVKLNVHNYTAEQFYLCWVVLKLCVSQQLWKECETFLKRKS